MCLDGGWWDGGFACGCLLGVSGVGGGAWEVLEVSGALVRVWLGWVGLVGTGMSLGRMRRRRRGIIDLWARGMGKDGGERRGVEW